MSLTALPSSHAATSDEGIGGPFSSVATGVSVSTQGVGFQLATPLHPVLNLRGGADFLPVSGISFTSNNINYNASATLASGFVTLDWMPFHGSFRLSPGLLINGSTASSPMSVPGGQYFTLNEVSYISSATNPIVGNTGVTWPKAGPRFTFGWGNMLPRRASKHFALTSEFGFAYLGNGTLTYNFTGTECPVSTPTTCASAATDPAFQANVTAVRTKYQKDVTNYSRFFPILKTGLSYRF